MLDLIQKHIDKIERVIEEYHGPYLNEPVCFTAVDAGATVAFKKVGTPDEANIVYATESSEQIAELDWKPYEFNKVVTLENPGDKVYFRAADENDITFYKDKYNYYRFVANIDEDESNINTSKKIAASGNIQTLMKADGSRLDISDKNNCFLNLFCTFKSLTTPPKLPATKLGYRSYGGMFYECSSLTAVPELPAEELGTGCYTGTFRGCTSLETAPKLSTMTLASDCYKWMFWGCASLKTPPELPAMTLANNCYDNMFLGCSSLTSAPELPATTLVNSCYKSMFNGCSSLTTAPELPATTLASNCYESMFNNCSKLSSINVNFTTWDVTNATTNWVTNTGTEITGEKIFTCPAELPDTRGTSNIPDGWTRIEK